MSERAKSHTSSARMDADGVRIVARDRRGRRVTVLYQALALFLVACSAGYVLTPPRSTSMSSPDATRPPVAATDKPTASSLRHAKKADDAAAQPAPSKIATASGRSMTPRHVEPTRPVPAPAKEDASEGDGDTTPDLSAFIPPGEAPTAGEVIEELHKAGIYSGIGAFPPPGTNPPLVGLAVPADFELPEGYVRHFQATDDGQPIEAILMFSPDYEFFDSDGQPIEIPENRVVPPELAPPGLPIRYIEIPPNLEPGDLSR